MKKIIFILLFYLGFTAFTITQASAGCNIIYSGGADYCMGGHAFDVSGGPIPTNETSRTIQAAQELYMYLGTPSGMTCGKTPIVYVNCYGFYSANNYWICRQEVCTSGTWHSDSNCIFSPDCAIDCLGYSGIWDVVCEPPVTTTTISTTTTIPPTVVSLIEFDAIPGNRIVTLVWSTASEIDNAGFNLYRSETENGEYVKINNFLISAQGSPTEGAFYEFVDKDVKNRKIHYYKLEDIDLNGNSTMHGPVSATPRLIYGIGK